MNPGKLFEQDFMGSVPADAYAYRLKDCPAWVSQCECPGGGTRFTPSNDYDFAVFWRGHLWALELKSVKGVSVRFDALRANQIAGLSKASGFKDVHAGILVEFRQVEEAWFVPIEDWLYYQETSPKKSVNVSEMLDGNFGWKLDGHKKRVRMEWKVQPFLERTMRS